MVKQFIYSLFILINLNLNAQISSIDSINTYLSNAASIEIYDTKSLQQVLDTLTSIVPQTNAYQATASCPQSPPIKPIDPWSHKD